MGKQGGFVGRIGNMIHYRVGDRYFSRSMPKTSRQSKATKARSLLFGMASTIGSLIRVNLSTVIFNPDDRKMQNKLVGEIYTWLQYARHQPSSPTTRPGFDKVTITSRCARISSRWFTKFNVTTPGKNQVSIDIPSFVPATSFKTPENCIEVNCRIASVVIAVESKKVLGSAEFKVTYSLNEKNVAAKKIVQKMPMPVGSILIVGMALEFMVRKNLMTLPTEDKRYKPSQIIYSAYF